MQAAGMRLLCCSWRRAPIPCRSRVRELPPAPYSSKSTTRTCKPKSSCFHSGRVDYPRGLFLRVWGRSREAMLVAPDWIVDDDSSGRRCGFARHDYWLVISDFGLSLDLAMS